jgi:hypothetical protein
MLEKVNENATARSSGKNMSLKCSAVGEKTRKDIGRARP